MRAVTPALAVPLLVAITVLLAAGVGAVALEIDPGGGYRPVALAIDVDPGTGTVALRHEAGPPLNVTGLRVRVAIDGTPLEHQPPVPFFAATGFRAGPTGPFNSAADPRWTPGERASFRIAGTNDPALAPGVAVTVRLYRGGAQVALLETRA